MMVSLDTNVLLRLLVEDDAQQTALVMKVLDQQVLSGQRLFVTATVILEVEWVLRSRYDFDKLSVIAALDALLSAAELEFQHEPALEQALWYFKRDPSHDFADCLHFALATVAGHLPLITFDKKAARLENVRLLGRH